LRLQTYGDAAFLRRRPQQSAGGYLTDDPQSAENSQVATVAAAASPVVRLDGQCYVFSTSRAVLAARGGLRYCAVVSPALGALFQSQFYGELAAGASPVISADGRHTVLFITEGEGEIEISGRRFAVGPRTGVYVRPSEAYRVHNGSAAPLKFFVSNGPGSEDLAWLDSMPSAFETGFPHRCATIDPAQRHKMAERYYQMMVNREHGSTVVTQFIGNIPLSKAEPHRHLYEEALIFLNGAGVVWTENVKTAVGAGDVLFLPRKQLHSVQCITPGGFDISASSIRAIIRRSTIDPRLTTTVHDRSGRSGRSGRSTADRRRWRYLLISFGYSD